MSFTTKKRWRVLKLRLMAGGANMWSAFMFYCEHWPTFNGQKGNGENTNNNNKSGAAVEKQHEMCRRMKGRRKSYLIFVRSERFTDGVRNRSKIKYFQVF